MKIPIVQRQDYTIYFEQVSGNTFVHCDVYKWTKGSKKALLEDWESLCLLHNAPIYAYHVVGDKKHLKFLEITGFRYVKTGLGNDLRLIQIYIKEIPDGTHSSISRRRSTTRGTCGFPV